MRRLVWVAVWMATLGCPGEECRDESASILVELAGDLGEAQSVEVRLAYDDTSRTHSANIEGSTFAPVRLGLIPTPTANAMLTVDVALYAEANARGRRVGTGNEAVNITDDGCNSVRVTVAPEGDPPRDGGVAEVDAGPDERDGGFDPRDAGLPPRDAGEPPDVCDQQPRDDSAMLFTFDALPEIADDTNSTSARYQSFNAEQIPRSVEGPIGCGRAIAFAGDGIVQVQGDSLAQGTGALDFWVRFDGDAPEGQGIVSRDATGQAQSGHFTVFRSCEDRVVVRLQDFDQSIYRCSNVPVARGEWVHVGINFGAPDLELFVDGAIQDDLDTAGADGLACQEAPVSCRGEIKAGLDGNDLPLVLGAATYQAIPGTIDPLSIPFTGALDAVHLRATRQPF